MKRKLLTGLLIGGIAVLAAAAGVAGWWIYQVQSEYDRGQLSYESLGQYAPRGASGPETAKVDFAALRQVNSQVVAWIDAPDTVISYPVAQGDDNAYYLNHLFDQSANRAGCIFLDSRNKPDFSDPNSILYGHYMKNGSMFAALKEYQDPTYFEEHPVMTLYTPEKTWTVRLFAGFVSDVQGNAWKVDFESEGEFNRWVEQLVERSLFSSGIVPKFGDRVLTLSTCSYDFENARFVLFGILDQ